MSPEAKTTRLGVAGWSIPAESRRSGSTGNTLLELYGELFNASEINSSFYRPHRFNTYQRWAESVPDDFSFSVKMPKLITHERRLAVHKGEIVEFTNCVRGLGHKLGVLLVQLPPSCSFDEKVARSFFDLLTKDTSATIACEARNPSWFTPAVDDLFNRVHVRRVAADPAPRGCKIDLVLEDRPPYLRPHGSPQIYYSAYSSEYLADLSALLRNQLGESWCIFDNTASGAAWHDAQALQRLLRAGPSASPTGMKSFSRNRS